MAGCSGHGCDRDAVLRGMCRRCYMAKYRKGELICKPYTNSLRIIDRTEPGAVVRVNCAFCRQPLDSSRPLSRESPAHHAWCFAVYRRIKAGTHIP